MDEANKQNQAVDPSEDDSQSADADNKDVAVDSETELVDAEESLPVVPDEEESSDDETTGNSIKDTEFRLNQDLIGDKKKHWYVINTYSGYEENVCQALRQRIDSMEMSHKIFDVIVPKEKKVEIKNGKKKIVEKKIFPGYVLVQMIVDEDSWYVVRNTPSVTGFIGFGNKPTPLSEDEIKNIQKRMGIEEPEFKIDFEEGESVKIIDGPFKDFDGVISEIDKIRGKIKVLVSMFGRETPVELDALQIKKL